MLRGLSDAQRASVVLIMKAHPSVPTPRGEATKVNLPKKVLELGRLVLIPYKLNGSTGLFFVETKLHLFDPKSTELKLLSHANVVAHACRIIESLVPEGGDFPLSPFTWIESQYRNRPK